MQNIYRALSVGTVCSRSRVVLNTFTSGWLPGAVGQRALHVTVVSARLVDAVDYCVSQRAHDAHVLWVKVIQCQRTHF